jgi:hypothetical protein
VSTGYWSREQRAKRLGPELFAYCEQVAADAPPPTAEQVALVGRAFDAAAKRIEARQRAGEQGPALNRAA